MSKRYVITAAIAVAMMMGVVAGFAAADDSAADPPVYVAHSYKLKFISTATDAENIKWDFGDGTVLDSREAGNPGYAELLAANGGTVWAPEHQYPESVNTDYVVVQTAYNPLGEDSVTRIIRIVGPPVVTFFGTSLAPVTVPYVDYQPQVLAKPADPVRDGHIFGGWYDDPALTQAHDWGQPVSGSVTVYAKWTPVGGIGPEGPGAEKDSRMAIGGTAIVLLICTVVSALATAIWVRHPIAVIVTIILAVFTGAAILGYLHLPEIVPGFKGVKV